ncbi:MULTISPECIES: copper resistance protein B [Pseudoxanthomonas]|uniref:Copper resistance protein B n=2 Tax=Pseudoxanthomonas TaxID=83618 RepID=A0A4V2HDF3_9GAMM|nr:copper resistance protein B [Pseudoxanthomonas winnipegensis]TMN18224.1 copper resistance protein B [Pseudoxanthomonas sp. X-1]UAY75546.1 copper resistance protein B [Pseudoxanthomonas sp. X-1]
MQTFPRTALALALGLLLSSPALAGQTTAETPQATCRQAAQRQASGPPSSSPCPHMSKQHASSMGGAAMDHAAMDHAAMDHSSMDHASMDHSMMAHVAMQEPREPIPVLTDEDRAAAFPKLAHDTMAHGSTLNWLVQIDRLEAWNASDAHGQAWEASSWIGGDVNRLWLRSEGERSEGRTESSDLEILYGRSVTPWWDVVAGVRQDFRPRDGRTWAALGVQGLAPYKFEVAATAYLGSGGQFGARLEAEYELLLSNRLILQPRIEADLSARDDPRTGQGSGLNSVEAGLRLRYEVTRRFAPYIGVNHTRHFGGSADAADHPRETALVAGVRVWF